MSTKLFRAVVGLGISIGSAVAACDGAIDAAPLAGDAAANGDASTSPDAPATSDGAAADVQAADVDTTDVADGGDLDVAADAIADAFCDFTWPTTKGSSPILPNCIDPTGVCWDSGMPIRCMNALGSHQCDIATSGIASSCRVDAGGWACPAGTVPMDQCWCFGELGDGQVCTAPDAGADAADQ